MHLPSRIDLRMRACCLFTAVTFGAIGLAACDNQKLMSPQPGVRRQIPPCEFTNPDCYDPPPPPPVDNSGYGVQVWSPAADAAMLSRIGQYVTASNVGWVRMEFTWDEMQPTGASMDPGQVQARRAFIDTMTARGIQVYAILNQSPAWARANYPPGDPCLSNNHCPPDPAMWMWWRAFVDSTVRLFPEISTWGVWNEPNDSFFLPQAPAHGMTQIDLYGYLVGYAYDAIHAYGKKLAAPELGAGPSNSPTRSYYCPTTPCILTENQWLEAFLADWGHKVDVVTVHKYDWADGNQSAMQGYGNVIRTGRRPYNWPLWLTEFGYQTPGADSTLNVIVRGTFERMRSGAEPLWKKSFVFDLYAPIGPYPEDYVLVKDMRTLNGAPQPRQAFYCLQAVASGSPPPSYCY
jgi:hypothetical protein